MLTNSIVSVFSKNYYFLFVDAIAVLYKTKNSPLYAYNFTPIGSDFVISTFLYPIDSHNIHVQIRSRILNYILVIGTFSIYKAQQINKYY